MSKLFGDGTTAANKSGYRPEIDGLRAIAVLSVLIHHLNAAMLPGGFVGVDIFFVISGTLITSQVVREAVEGRFSVRQFYKRRINRILPALMVVVGTTSIAGAFILSPSDLVLFARSAVSAGFGLSNVFFWRAYGNYFAHSTAEAPLLHTWSLGVEEQFYAIWPLLILLFLKLKRRYRLSLFALLTVAAIAISQAGTAIVASAAYYLLPARFFELMIGGMLALAFAHRSVRTGLVAELGAVAGFALIAGSLFLLNRTSAFPGVNALWPCLGAALLILFGERSKLASAILTFRPLVFVGLISYSIYLWHWPILAFLHYLRIDIGPILGVAVALASIAVAWLSWKFVEVPMRRSGAAMSFPRVFLWRFALPVLALIALASAVRSSAGLPRRFDSRVAALDRMRETKPEELRRGCHVPTALYATPINSTCLLGKRKSEADGILIGDSFANHFSGLVDTMGMAEGLSFIDYTMSACPPILGYNNGIGTIYADDCLRRNRMAYGLIAANRYKRVILAADWPQGPEAGSQLADSIAVVLNTGTDVTLILANTSIRDASTCSVRSLMYRWNRSCDSPRQPAGLHGEHPEALSAGPFRRSKPRPLRAGQPMQPAPGRETPLSRR